MIAEEALNMALFSLRTSLTEIDPNQQDMYSPLANLYMGVKVSEQLKHPRITPEMADEFRQRCRSYMVTLCNGIKKRFDFGDPLLQALPVLKPKVSVTYEARQFTNSILPFADLVPRAKPADPEQLQALDDQWRRLPLDPDIPKEILQEEEVDVFWSKVHCLARTFNVRRSSVSRKFLLIFFFPDRRAKR